MPKGKLWKKVSKGIDKSFETVDLDRELKGSDMGGGRPVTRREYIKNKIRKKSGLKSEKYQKMGKKKLRVNKMKAF